MKYIKPLPAAQKTFFYERTKDQTWFACEENEAYLQELRRSNTVRLVGVSDGKTYHSMMVKKSIEITDKANELDKKLANKKMSQTRYDTAIEKLNEELLMASREATQAEYDIAKGHLERPIDPNSRRSENRGLSSSQQNSLNQMLK